MPDERETLRPMSDSYRLVIARHATAASVLGATDQERPLSAHGEDQAVEAGAWLATACAPPDRVLCSPTHRTRRTWELIAACLPAEPAVSYETDIYHNDMDELLDLVHGVGSESHTVLLVGHNPAVYQLLLVLTEDHEGHDGFPAGSLAVVDLAVPWPYVAPGAGVLTAFWTPDRA